MLISDKLQLIFAHIPKTGGASLKGAICKVDAEARNVGSYHNRITKDFLKEIPKYKKYHKITIVRNSYQIVASKYNFRHMKNKELEQKKQIPSFKEWIKKSKSIIFNQLAYIIEEDTRLVDEILFYNNLENGVTKLNKKLKTNINVSQFSFHKYNNYNYKDFYDEESKALVYNKCKKDINYFNWSFDV